MILLICLLFCFSVDAKEKKKDRFVINSLKHIENYIYLQIEDVDYGVVYFYELRDDLYEENQIKLDIFDVMIWEKPIEIYYYGDLHELTSG
jgi:hypothetical protein